MVAVTAALLAQLGLLNGCVLDLNAILDVAVCPSGVDLTLPTSWATSAGDHALTFVKDTLPVAKRTTCSTAPVTVDPLDIKLGLSTEDTVALQVALGVLDLLNVHLDLSLDLAALLDLIVNLDINLLDLVNLDLDVTIGVGKLLDALLNLDLGLTVADLLSLDLDVGVDLTVLKNLGDEVSVTLGAILNLADCTADNVVQVLDKLLVGIAPVVDNLLGTVVGLVDGLVGTVGSLLSGLLGKRQTRAELLSLAMARRSGGSVAARSGSAPTHPIQFIPTCGTALSNDAAGVTEVLVGDLVECVSKCHLSAAGGLLDAAVNANINVLNAVNIDLCLAVSLLGDVTSSGQTTCRFITGQGIGSTVPSSAFKPIAGASSYIPKY